MEETCSEYTQWVGCTVSVSHYNIREITYSEQNEIIKK